mmetsp:Transcript_3256/g.5263  ORF Transcript_3256/g.5263 Transcript_3256/m.5263 type:complete len:226 (+) Transcript_3256:589-1266(+)
MRRAANLCSPKEAKLAILTFMAPDSASVIYGCRLSPHSCLQCIESPKLLCADGMRVTPVRKAARPGKRCCNQVINSLRDCTWRYRFLSECKMHALLPFVEGAQRQQQLCAECRSYAGKRRRPGSSRLGVQANLLHKEVYNYGLCITGTMENCHYGLHQLLATRFCACARSCTGDRRVLSLSVLCARLGMVPVVPQSTIIDAHVDGLLGKCHQRCQDWLSHTARRL